nr:MAG: ORF5 [Chickpea chlorotic stunt virus]
MWKWEDDNWMEVNLQANYAVNNSQYAEPYTIIPASKGKFHVYLECDGQMAVKSVGGKADNSWRGLIAYDTSRRMWNVGNYKGCVIENYKKTDSFVLGHPDVEVNDCKFDKARGVEADWYASFQLTCDDDEGAWILYAPPIPKDSLYNYTVSYGEYTENMCEWGAVSISIDEDNNSTGNEVRVKPSRGRQMCWAEPEGKLEEQPLETNEVKIISIGKENPAANPTDSSEVRGELNYSLERSDSEDEIPEAPDIVPGMRMAVETPFKQPADLSVLRDRGVATSWVEPSFTPGQQPQIDEDPWAHVRSFNEQNQRSGPSSVAGKSLGGGSLRSGALKPPPPIPVEKVGNTLDYTHYETPGTPILARKDPVLSKPNFGSTVSSLRGGFLKSKNSEKFSQLTTAERSQYEQIRASFGKTKAEEFLTQLLDRKNREGK